MWPSRGLRLATAASRGSSATPPHQSTRCRKHQYHYVRAALQFLKPLLPPQHHPAHDNLRCVDEACAGVPHTLQHSGPIHHDAMACTRQHLTNAMLRNLQQHTIVDGMPISPVLPNVAAQLWPEEMLQTYTQHMIDVRRKDLQHKKNFGQLGELKEAGSFFMDLLRHAPLPPESVAVWEELIDAYTLMLPDRSHGHELENLPQEMAIGELVRRCVEEVRAEEGAVFSLERVVDVGGGNGFLAAQVGERIGCDSVVIDPSFPPHSIDCCPRPWRDATERRRPSRPRRFATRRTTAFFKHTRWEDAVGASPAHTALIAKHLCGTAIDECLRHMEEQRCLPRILILAPCCFNKGMYAEYVDENFLATELGVASPAAYDHLTRLTDLNASVHQRCGGDVVGTEGRRKKRLNFRHPCTCGVAAAVEAALNCGRMRWLAAHGYRVAVVQYVPSFITPKNKCMVAVRVGAM